MTSLAWLHLSDLHHGMSEHATLFPMLRRQLEADLDRLAEAAGPWDLVLFTGDLTQSGSAAEYASLEESLDRLMRHVEQRTGVRPALLAVPGNHDLVRPRPSAVVRALRHWHDEREIRADLFRDADNEYRSVVEQAFAPFTAFYERWQKAHPPPPSLRLTVRKGTLPGEFSAVVEKQDIRIGIVGLNTSFLQLTGDNYEGRLDLDPRQLHAACGGDAPDWLDSNHANLLLTHHPPEWLHVRALAIFRAEIAPAGSFAAHLFGHMHEPMADFHKMAGSAAELRLQASSLFGLDQWGSAAAATPNGGPPGHSRIHGYSAGRVAVRRGEGRLSIWPRTAITVLAGHRKIVPDESFDLDRDGAFHADIPVRRLASPSYDGPPLPAAPSRPSLNASSVPPTSEIVSAPGSLQDPGGPYDPRWYVPPESAIGDALSRLRQPGQPVAVWGPTLFGKSWLIRHTLARLAEDSPDNRIVLINLRLLDDDCMATLGAFLQELAAQIAERLAFDPSVVEVSQQRSGTPLRKLDRIFRSYLLPAVKGSLVLALDHADELVQRPWSDDFFGLLRAWCDEAFEEPLSASGSSWP